VSWPKVFDNSTSPIFLVMSVLGVSTGLGHY